MKDVNVLLTPIPVVTIIPTVPTMWAGVIHVIVVLFTTLRDVALNPSNVTTLAPVKEVPVIVTKVPPFVLPDDGEMLVMLGGVI